MVAEPLPPSPPVLQRSGGKYLLVIQQETQIQFRFNVRAEAFISGYDARTTDLALDVNFYPHRAALFKKSGGRYVRVPGDDPDAELPMDMLAPASIP